MINIDEYEKYIKETNWKEHEYINNLLYSFFIRTLNYQKNIKDFIYTPEVTYNLELKDVIIYKTEYVRITLQEIIYTICPDYYKEKQQNINISTIDKPSISSQPFAKITAVLTR